MFSVTILLGPTRPTHAMRYVYYDEHERTKQLAGGCVCGESRHNAAIMPTLHLGLQAGGSSEACRDPKGCRPPLVGHAPEEAGSVADGRVDVGEAGRSSGLT